MKFTSWRKHGTTDFTGWVVGAAITALDQIKVGDILFSDSEQFDALNLCRVTRINEKFGDKCYATLCNPINVAQGRTGGSPEPEFCIWDFDIPRDSFGNRYLRAVKDDKPFRLIVATQVRENYGAHDWDGEGACPQYWKNKLGGDYVIARYTAEEAARLTQADIDALVAKAIADYPEFLARDDDYYKEYAVGHQLTDKLTEFEASQLEHELEITHQAEDLAEEAARMRAFLAQRASEESAAAAVTA